MIYEIQSGKPAGEIRHRAIFAARSAEEAEHCRDNVVAHCERYPGESHSQEWLWGPHIFVNESQPTDEDGWPAEFWYDYCAQHGIAR